MNKFIIKISNCYSLIIDSINSHYQIVYYLVFNSYIYIFLEKINSYILFINNYHRFVMG